MLKGCHTIRGSIIWVLQTCISRALGSKAWIWALWRGIKKENIKYSIWSLGHLLIGAHQIVPSNARESIGGIKNTSAHQWLILTWNKGNLFGTQYSALHVRAFCLWLSVDHSPLGRTDMESKERMSADLNLHVYWVWTYPSFVLIAHSY